MPKRKKKCFIDAGKGHDISFCSPVCPAYRHNGVCLYLNALRFIFTDKRLQGTQIGEGKNVEDLILENYEFLKNYCYKLSKNLHVGEDLCQEVLRKAIENKDKFKPDQPILPWLLRTAKNLFIDYYRKQKSMVVEDIELINIGTEDTSFLKMENMELASIFALASLTEQQREALELVYVEGFSLAEAAEKMGLSYKGFYSLLRRAQKKLRDELKEFFI